MTLLLLVLACSGGEAPSAAPAAPGAAGSPAAPGAAGSPAAPLATEAGHYRLTWRAIPEPIPLSELFEVETVLTLADGTPVEVGSVRVDAEMPQHGHGMATRPEADPGECDAAGACRHPGGVYRTRGMKFHMPGAWVVVFEVDGPKGPDRLKVEKTL